MKMGTLGLEASFLPSSQSRDVFVQEAGAYSKWVCVFYSSPMEAGFFWSEIRAISFIPAKIVSSVSTAKAKSKRSQECPLITMPPELCACGHIDNMSQ